MEWGWLTVVVALSPKKVRIFYKRSPNKVLLDLTNFVKIKLLMNKEDLISFKRKYQNKWVARSPKTGEVLDSDKNLKELAVKLDGLHQDYTLEKVLPLNRAFIP